MDLKKKKKKFCSHMFANPKARTRRLHLIAVHSIQKSTFLPGGIGMFYNFLCPKLDNLMGPFYHGRVFPATAWHQTDTAISYNTLRSLQRRVTYVPYSGPLI